MNDFDPHQAENDLREQELEGYLNRFLDELRSAIILKGGDISMNSLNEMPFGELYKMVHKNGIQLGFRVMVHSDKVYF